MCRAKAQAWLAQGLRFTLAFGVLCACFALGKALQTLGAQQLGWVFLAGVWGMGLLFAVLCWRGKVPAALEVVASGLLRHLLLFLLPTMVGVLAMPAMDWQQVLALLFTCAVGALAALVVTGWVLKHTLPQTDATSPASQPP
jgi:holin-like protein